MRTESAMLERWFFYQDAAGLWKWARLDVLGTVLGHSGSSFETRDACVEHAILNGYEDGKKSHCGPCTACCASASITGTVALPIPPAPVYGKYVFLQLTPRGVQPHGLDRPPLAL